MKKTYLFLTIVLLAVFSNVLLSQNIEFKKANFKDKKEEFGDSFISIEHLILALAVDPRCCSELIQKAGAGANEIKLAINNIRGTQKVVDQNPERTYIKKDFQKTS